MLQSVFISYCHTDRETVEKICAGLERRERKGAGHFQIDTPHFKVKVP